MAIKRIFTFIYHTFQSLRSVTTNVASNMNIGNLTSNMNIGNLTSNMNIGNLTSNLSNMQNKMQEMATLENLQDGFQVNHNFIVTQRRYCTLTCFRYYPCLGHLSLSKTFLSTKFAIYKLMLLYNKHNLPTKFYISYILHYTVCPTRFCSQVWEVWRR